MPVAHGLPHRANGLAVTGVEETRKALEMGQVDELIITAVPDAIDAGTAKAGDIQPDRTTEERAADELIVKATQTSAKIRFIEWGVLGSGGFCRTGQRAESSMMWHRRPTHCCMRYHLGANQASR